jgi:DNA processing protein
MIKRKELLLLNMAGVGKKTIEKLSKDELQKNIDSVRNEHDLEAELKLTEKHNVNVTTIYDRSYPKLLKEIHSPPIVLYSKGEILAEDELAVAIVGARIASVYGLRTAEKLGCELASRGLVVVSGLARGIDSAAHKGALKAHGKTIAVLGSGLDVMYPPENEKLAAEIVEKKGALVSEFPMGTPPNPKNFPQRNRIISGLSLAVVVVEAARNSGALITADFALEQNREVFAVPGKVDSATSFGTNELIKQGAKLTQTADDIIDELGLKLKASAGTKEQILRPRLSADEEQIYKNLSDDPKYIDEVMEAAKLPLAETTRLLFGLQLKKLVKELPGKNFIRA